MPKASGAAIKENSLEGCYVAGHSMGGAIAMSLALASPELLAGLVLVGTGARLKVFPQILEGILNEKEETVRAIMGFAFSKKAPPDLVESGLRRDDGLAERGHPRRFLRVRPMVIHGAVKSIELPTLIVTGADDALTPLKYSEYLDREIRGSRLSVIPDAGHMVMREKPEETNRAIEAFVTHR